jgi:6-phosphofructokinase 1
VRIAVSTGGGDAPGLNAAIRAVALAGAERQWDVVGIRRGFHGLLETPRELVTLDRAAVRGIGHQGGTILGTTNRGNPFKWASGSDERDRSDELIAAAREAGLDAVVLVGGDGTMRIARDLWKKGLAVVGIPKTIDNDLYGTAATIGFDTAVSIATEALDRIHSTAESHERVMVVEVMGRYAGWIALHAGVAGGADVILLPEIPFDLEAAAEKIRRRERMGRNFSIVVVAEGATPREGARVLREEKQAGGVERLGGIGEQVARELGRLTGRETRSLALGHLQRGGSPTTFDRLMATRFGAAAVRAAERREFGMMVAYRPPTIVSVPLDDVVGHTHNVPPDGDTVATAHDLGICLGDR